MEQTLEEPHAARAEEKLEPHEQFGRDLVKARIEKRISRQAICDETGLTTNAYCALESGRGQGTTVNVGHLMIIANLLNRKLEIPGDENWDHRTSLADLRKRGMTPSLVK